MNKCINNKKGNPLPINKQIYLKIGGVAQDGGPEFKPQYHTHTQKNKRV
jgi:hypothetical protein